MSMFPGCLNQFCSAVLCGALLLGVAPQSAALDIPVTDKGCFSIETGLENASGYCDAETHSSFTTAPYGFGYHTSERIKFELSMPYPFQDDINALHAAGKTYLYSQSIGAPSPGRFQSAAGGSNAVAGGSRAYAFDHGNSQTEPGNRTLAAGYRIFPEENFLPQLRATFYLQFLTADRYNGPGSGEFDAGPGLAIDKWFGKWNLFAEGRYVFQGETDQYATQEYAEYSAGIGYQIIDDLYVALFGNGATVPADDSQDLLEGGFRINWLFLKKAGLECYVSKGLNDWSPGYGAGLALLSYF